MSRKSLSCTSCGASRTDAGRIDLRLRVGSFVIVWRGRLCDPCAAALAANPDAVLRLVLKRPPDIEPARGSHKCL
jgi:hypothetical protein